MEDLAKNQGEYPEISYPKKISTSIFGANVDRSVYNTNFNGELKTSSEHTSTVMDIITLVLICGGICLLLYLIYRCRRRERINQINFDSLLSATKQHRTTPMGPTVVEKMTQVESPKVIIE
jgi:beta-lactamase regulating signal transducer with metallopeptidase domain